MHRVKSEEVKCKKAKRIVEKNGLRERKKQKSIDSFKDTSWINQKFYYSRLWNKTKKAMDEFEKIIAQSNKHKCVKEKILIVHLGLVFEESHHPWSRDRYKYSDVELLEHFVKVCLPLTKNKNLPKEAPMEHPRLPEFPTLGTLMGNIDEYYSERAKNENQPRLKSLGER